jgi:uncharacterized membrane protein
MAAAPEIFPAPTPSSRFSGKTAFWAVLGLAGLSVLLSTEYPILHDRSGPNHDYFLKLLHDRLLLIPHAAAGTIALLSGPLQFSTRFRRKHLKFHRVLGRVYVGAIFVAAPLTFILTRGSGLEVGTWVQSGAWMICTLAALLTARNRQIAAHRQWMIRSYAVTLTFVSLRVPNFWPAYANMSPANFTLVILIVTFASVFLPDLYFSRRELTTAVPKPRATQATR